ncbi:TIGR01244 family phosphatase [Rhodobacteraceae bacterium]|nr:TIGR01244 family phosphatase [Paracoccaceae bacterium]
MDIRPLSPTFSVAPQIEADELRAVAQLGFKTLIINRPDEEVDADHAQGVIAKSAKDAGLSVHYLPFFPGHMTQDLVEGFEETLRSAEEPVLAYCRSGTRSSHLWAMAQAGAGVEIDAIVEAAGKAGYDHSQLVPLLTAYAKKET